MQCNNSHIIILIIIINNSTIIIISSNSFCSFTELTKDFCLCCKQSVAAKGEWRTDPEAFKKDAEQRKKKAALEEEELISIQIFNDTHQYFIDIRKKMDDEYEEAMQWAAVHASKRSRKAFELKYTATHEQVMKDIKDFEEYIFGQEFQEYLSDTRKRGGSINLRFN